MLVEDVLTIVFERLPVDAICAAACVSRSWAGVGEMDCVWFPRLQRLLRARAFVSDHIRVAFEAWRRSGAGPVPSSTGRSRARAPFAARVRAHRTA